MAPYREEMIRKNLPQEQQRLIDERKERDESERKSREESARKELARAQQAKLIQEREELVRKAREEPVQRGRPKAEFLQQFNEYDGGERKEREEGARREQVEEVKLLEEVAKIGDLVSAMERLQRYEHVPPREDLRRSLLGRLAQLRTLQMPPQGLDTIHVLSSILTRLGKQQATPMSQSEEREEERTRRASRSKRTGTETCSRRHRINCIWCVHHSHVE